jgi:hypothetical protein
MGVSDKMFTDQRTDLPSLCRSFGNANYERYAFSKLAANRWLP